MLLPTLEFPRITWLLVALICACYASTKKSEIRFRDERLEKQSFVSTDRYIDASIILHQFIIT